MYISVKEFKNETDYKFAVEQFKLIAKTKIKASEVKVKSKQMCKDYLVLLVYPNSTLGQYKAPKCVDIKCVSEKELNEIKLNFHLTFFNKTLWHKKTTLEKLKSNYTNYLYKEQTKILSLADKLNKIIIDHQAYCYSGPYDTEVEDAKPTKINH